MPELTHFEITIEKFTNAELRVYISKVFFKTQHLFPHDICLSKRLRMKYVGSIWHMDERLLILGAIKSLVFFNSRSLARCKIRPNKNTMEECFLSYLFIFFFFFLLLIIRPYFAS